MHPVVVARAGRQAGERDRVGRDEVLSTAVAVQAVVPGTRYSTLTCSGLVGGPGDGRRGCPGVGGDGGDRPAGPVHGERARRRVRVHVARLVHGADGEGVGPSVRPVSVIVVLEDGADQAPPSSCLVLKGAAGVRLSRPE